MLNTVLSVTKLHLVKSFKTYRAKNLLYNHLERALKFCIKKELS